MGRRGCLRWSPTRSCGIDQPVRGFLFLTAIALLIGFIVREVLKRRGEVRRADDARQALEQARQEAEDSFGDREQLAGRSVGGSPQNPIVVTASSVIEARAGVEPCIRCFGDVRVDEHTAESHGGHTLRVAHIRCAHCDYQRRRYFVIQPAQGQLH